MTKAHEIWVGAYAAKNEIGITRMELLPETGELFKTAEYGNIENASFLRMNKEGTRLYAVSETDKYVDVDGDEAEGGQLASFPVDPDTRKLGPGTYAPTHGIHPCHLSLTPTEDWVAVTNYGGASVTMYPVNPDTKPGPPMIRFRHTGTGPNADRQEAPHPHSAFFSGDGRLLYVCDLGMDKVLTYERGPEAHEWSAYDAVSLEPGAGPRHLAFRPESNDAYVLNELDSTVTHFKVDEEGKLNRRASLTTLPASFKGESTCAEILVSPDGRFAYASNRGHDSIAVFRIDETTGELQASGHVSTRGKTPRNFALTPDGQWLLAANQQSDSVVLFRIEPHTGLPIYAGVELPVSKPVCVLIR
ncbi:lactonase family protein [Cohnella endophytica]|uniref:Lactonase family protein n=1 Tax=Cohnella endophytica TaxID=2419778 RepID=A0A494X3Z6_9BACL|nr:lactonase family protein [Cohnella endophytica]RKP45418.1 lactonase family protein [Cohnella endophytica]